MISVVPAFAAVTVPSETVATASLLDDHTTVSVVLAGSTVAVNVKDSPVIRFWLDAFSVIEVAGTETGVMVRVPFVLNHSLQNGKKRSLLFRGSQQ